MWGTDCKIFECVQTHRMMIQTRSLINPSCHAGAEGINSLRDGIGKVQIQKSEWLAYGICQRRVGQHRKVKRRQRKTQIYIVLSSCNTCETVSPGSLSDQTKSPIVLVPSRKIITLSPPRKASVIAFSSSEQKCGLIYFAVEGITWKQIYITVTLRSRNFSQGTKMNNVTGNAIDRELDWQVACLYWMRCLQAPYHSLVCLTLLSHFFAEVLAVCYKFLTKNYTVGWNWLFIWLFYLSLKCRCMTTPHTEFPFLVDARLRMVWFLLWWSGKEQGQSVPLSLIDAWHIRLSLTTQLERKLTISSCIVFRIMFCCDVGGVSRCHGIKGKSTRNTVRSGQTFVIAKFTDLVYSLSPTGSDMLTI